MEEVKAVDPTALIAFLAKSYFFVTEFPINNRGKRIFRRSKGVIVLRICEFASLDSFHNMSAVEDGVNMPSKGALWPCIWPAKRVSAPGNRHGPQSQK
jgi:hypothetical protein